MMANQKLADQVQARMRELGLQDDPLDALAKVASGIESETETYSVMKDGRRQLTGVKVTRTQTSLAAGIRLLERMNGGALGLGGTSNAPRQIGKDFFTEFAPEVDDAIFHRDVRQATAQDGGSGDTVDATGTSDAGGAEE
jgi:hypothetical protein